MTSRRPTESQGLGERPERRAGAAESVGRATPAAGPGEQHPRRRRNLNLSRAGSSESRYSSPPAGRLRLRDGFRGRAVTESHPGLGSRLSDPIVSPSHSGFQACFSRIRIPDRHGGASPPLRQSESPPRNGGDSENRHRCGPRAAEDFQGGRPRREKERARERESERGRERDGPRQVSQHDRSELGGGAARRDDSDEREDGDGMGM